MKFCRERVRCGVDFGWDEGYYYAISKAKGLYIWLLAVFLALAIPAACYYIIEIIHDYVRPPDYKPACMHNLRTLYMAINYYGDEHGALPAMLISNDEWAQFLEEYLDPDYVRKVLTCPSEWNASTGGSKWKSSYAINPEVLGNNWETTKKLPDIPLLVEKSPNHNGRYHVIFTNGVIELRKAK